MLHHGSASGNAPLDLVRVLQVMTKNIISILAGGPPNSLETVCPDLLVCRLANILQPLAYESFTTVRRFHLRVSEDRLCEPRGPLDQHCNRMVTQAGYT